MKQKQIPVAIAAALSAFSAQAASAVQEVVCENPSGCNYIAARNQRGAEAWGYHDNYRTWAENGRKDILQAIDVENIRVTVKPGRYQNRPATHTGYIRSQEVGMESEKYDKHSNRIIGISNLHIKDRSNSELVVPSGSTLVLSEDYEGSKIIAVDNANATIAKNVTLIVEPSYAEKNGVDVRRFDKRVEGAVAGDALSVYGGELDSKDGKSTIERPAYVKSSADIVLNGVGSAGVTMSGQKGKVELSDHRITMNAERNFAIISDHDGLGGKVRAERVNIVSGRPVHNQVGLLGGDIDFLNGNITLPEDYVNAAVWMSGKKAALNISQSNISARYVIAAVGHSKDYPSTEAVINLNHSTVRGKGALLAVNPVETSSQQYAPRLTDFRGNLTINAHNSQLYGKSEFNRQSADAVKNRNITLNMTDNSEWKLNGNSELDHLKIAGSQVHFEKGGEFKTLTVHGDLSGNGRFNMNTDLARQQGDKLVVKGQVSGSHLVSVNNSEAEPPTDPNRSLTLVQSGGGNGTFALAGGHVDAGAFRYRLAKHGNDWALAYSENAPKTPDKQHEASKNTGHVLPNATLPAPSAPNTALPSVPPVVSAPPQAASPQPPALPAPRMLSSYAAQNLAHFQAAAHNVQQQNDTLNQRLADLHSAGYLNGLWTEGENGSVQRYGRAAAPNVRSPAIRETRHAYQIGYDYRFGAGYAGALAGQGRSRLHYRDGDYPDSTLKHDTFATYGGVSAGDWFVDGVWRHNRYKGIGAGSTQRFRTDTLTLQGGANLAVNGHWYVSPQAGLTAGYLSGSRADKTMLLQTRTGVSVHGWLPLGHVVLKPAFGLHYLGDHRKTTVNFNGHRLAAPQAGGRVAVSAGAGVDFNIRHSLNVKLQGEYGRHLRRPYHIGIGYRFSW